MPYIDPLILNDPQLWSELVNWFFCAFMGGCFLLWTMAYLLPVRKTGRALLRVSSEPIWSEETTALDSRRLRAAELVRKAGDSRLERVFNLFKSQWSVHTARVRGVETSTVDIAQVADEDSLMPERFATWFAPSIPGFFTGAGILGTFVGLVLGLMGVGFGTTGGGEFFGSVLSLLSGMYTAFITSIVGISLSLTWIVLDGACRGRMLQGIERFHMAVRAVYPSRSSADLMLSLVDTSSRTEKTMEQFSKRISDLQVQAIRDLSDHFVDRLGEAAGGQFEAVAATLEGVVRWQSEIESSLVSLKTRSGESAEGLLKVVQATEGLQARLAEADQGVAGADAAHRDATRKLTAVLEDFVAQLSSVQEQHARGSLAVYETEMNRVSRNLTSVLEQTRNAMAELEVVLARVNRAASQDGAQSSRVKGSRQAETVGGQRNR